MKYRILQFITVIISLGAALYLWDWETSASVDQRPGHLSASLKDQPPEETKTTVRSTPIEQIRVGNRVLAHNPELDDADRIDVVEPDETWKQIDFLLRGDGPGEPTVEIVLLRPQSWVDDNNAEIGSYVYLDLAELGAEGDAEVIDLQPAPPIDSGEGSVVTATFKHTPKGEIFDILIEGEAELIGVTGAHPFWSVDRQEFVPVSELSPDETLLARDGTNRKIVSLLPRPGPEPVYNIEVHDEHVYQVGGEGLLVHNSYGRNIPKHTGYGAFGRGKAPKKVTKIEDVEIIVDENLSPSLIPLLRNQGGLNAIRLPDGTLDADIIARAKKNGSAILTNNTQDFINQGIPVISVPEHLKPRSSLFDLTIKVINVGGQTATPTTVINIGKKT